MKVRKRLLPAQLVALCYQESGIPLFGTQQLAGIVRPEDLLPFVEAESSRENHVL